MNFEACDGARLILLLNIRVICEIRVRLLSPRKRIIDSWCLVLPPRNYGLKKYHWILGKVILDTWRSNIGYLAKYPWMLF